MILRPQEFDNGVNKWKTFSDFYFSESVRGRVDVEMCLLVIDDKVADAQGQDDLKDHIVAHAWHSIQWAAATSLCIWFEPHFAFEICIWIKF